MRKVPEELLSRPFTRAEALQLGVSSKMLEGRRFVRVLPRVWRHVDHAMTHQDWIDAALLAAPAGAYTTGITRIQQLGLGFGAELPIHLVVQSDHHLVVEGIFLHRTVMLPPTDEVGVVPAAAFIAFCTSARVIDAIRIGDWLLHHGHMTLEEVRDLCTAQPWRDGAREAEWVLSHLDPGSRSLPESETRGLLEFAGLPRPEVNGRVPQVAGVEAIGDLVYAAYRTVVEYEGQQHQDDRAQFVGDIDRYALFRRHDVRYVQVTKEKLRVPRTLVRAVHSELVAGGYDGPEPVFGERWDSLFRPIREVAGAREGHAA